jgi:hypothetical protein
MWCELVVLLFSMEISKKIEILNKEGDKVNEY